MSNACFATKQNKVLPRFYTTWKNVILVFSMKNGWWMTTPCTWNFESNMTPFEQKRRFSIDIRCSASAVTPSEKSSINTNRKSTTHFPMSLRWTSCVALKPPKRAQNTQNGHFPRKITLHLKEVGYNVSMYEYCQRQSCKVFTGLSIRAKMVRGWRPLLRENLAETQQPPL